MSDIFARYAALRSAYPDDIERIEAEEAEVKRLLELKDYASNPTTGVLLDMCRREVLSARMKLATDRTLTEQQRQELWGIVDARAWFIGIVGKNFDAELARIERDLETELSRA